MMVNGATGLCLTVAGAAADDGARVQQEPCGDAPHQQLGAVRRRRRQGHLRRRSTAAGASTSRAAAPAPGTPVQQFGCNGTPAQRWFLQPV